MLLKCDACGREYRFPDQSIKGFTLIGSPHAALPVGKGCAGTLRSEASPPSAEVEWR